MKRLNYFLLVALISCAFVGTSPASASTRENNRLRAGKITKNEAQHLVLKKYPGAQLKKCKLSGAPDHGIWLVEFVEAGGTKIARARVDGRSGKILP
ncbi:MAG: PepSY domain-containing protein [Chthoniobacterales bacterium]